MAKLRVSNTKISLPVYNKFIASKPVITNCFFQENLNSNLNNRAYYYNGNEEPKVGDTIFLDINGIEKYNFNSNYIQYKEDINNYYYLNIINSKVATIEICPKIEFKEFEVLEQDPLNICKENSFYPESLDNISEVFYHNGDGQFPVIGDVVYNSTIPSDKLNNFTGLFNIINNVYYYFLTDNSGIIFNIKSCTKPNIYPTRNISLIPVTNFIDGNYREFNCEIPNNNRENIYYKSELQIRPAIGSIVYSDFNLNNIIQNKSYYLNTNNNTRNYMLIDNEGKVSYTSCNFSTPLPEINEPEEENIQNYYFYGQEITTPCERPRSLVKFYYSKNTSGGAYGKVPPLLTLIYSDNSLDNSTLQTSKIIYLYIENNIRYSLYTNGSGEFFTIRGCETLSDADDDTNIQI